MNREDIAWKEIGHTDIGRMSARFLLVCFVLTLLLIPGIQVGTWTASGFVNDAQAQFPMLRSLLLPVRGYEGVRESEGNLWARLHDGNRAMLREIASIEDDLDEVSVAGDAIRPAVQEALVSVGWGTERVLLGGQGWLFFKPAVDYLTGAGFLDRDCQKRRVQESDSWETPPSPDPLPAILEFAEQLNQRNIELILVPIPVKAGVVPEKLSSRLVGDEVLHNVSWVDFLSQLKTGGVRIETIDTVLKENQPAFLKTDTHWSWSAMDRVAERLAAALRTSGVNASYSFEETSQTVNHRGDIYQMLPMLSTSFYPEETVTIKPLSQAHPDQVAEQTQVFLLGDSFSNIYSDNSLGWGANAGFSERLAWHLQAPVASIIRNNDGAFATRLELLKRLAQDPGYLDGISFVVWEFTERELSFGDWRLFGPLNKSAGAGAFVTLNAGEIRQIRARIHEMGEIPNPDEAAYPDYIIALHLVDVYSEDVSVPEEALVFVWAMQDYKLLQGATLNEGDQITLQIQPWADVSSTLDTITRGEIFGERLLMQDPCWGEDITR